MRSPAGMVGLPPFYRFPHILNSAPATEPKPAPKRDRLSLEQVDLHVTNLERAAAFWTAALGLIERDTSATRIALGTQERTLVVLHGGAKILSKRHTRACITSRSGGWDKLVFEER